MPLRPPSLSEQAEGDSPLPAFARLFNEGKFFEAHEALEDAWRAAKLAEAKRDPSTRPRGSSPTQGVGANFLKGFIHMAVAFVHAGKGNKHGAVVKARSALALLEANADSVPPAWKREAERLLPLLRAALAEFEAGNLDAAAPRLV